MKKTILKMMLGLSVLALWSCDEDNGLTESIPQTGDIKYGSGSFVFDAYEPFQDRPIRVYYYNPGNAADLPIMIYMHGNGRNASGYRDGMAQHAYDHNFLLIVPEFTAEDYSSREYHRGGVVNADDEPVDEAEWTFSMIEPLFDYVKEDVGSEQEGYALYGFSAGGQFVHRFMWHKPDSRAEIAIAGAAGNYTMPDWDVDYSFGLNNTVVDEESLKKVLQRKMIVIVGGDDTGLEDVVSSANAQGWNRVERARTFFNKSQAMAGDLDTPFNWGFGTVPGVGHSHRGMAGMAADLAFGTELEPPMALETYRVRLDRPGYNASPNMLDVINIKRHSRNEGMNVQPEIDFGLWNSSSSDFTMMLPTADDRLGAFGSGRDIRDEWETRNDGMLMKLPADSNNRALFEGLETEGDILAAFEAAEDKLDDLGLDEYEYGPGKHVQWIGPGELIFFHSFDRDIYMVAIVESTDNQSTGYADLDIKRMVIPD